MRPLDDRPYVAEAETSLYAGVLKNLERATLKGHTDNVLSASFSPDGRRVVIASDDDTARLWPGAGQTLVDHAKEIVPRCLSQAQRQRYYLPPEPPRLCIPGAGREAETDPAKWQPKPFYRTAAWRDWLTARDKGETPPLPCNKAELKEDKRDPDLLPCDEVQR